MYYSWCILGCHWDVCIVAGIYWAVTGYIIVVYNVRCMYYSWCILGCHWDVCIVAGIYWAVTGMYVL